LGIVVDIELWAVPGWDFFGFAGLCRTGGLSRSSETSDASAWFETYFSVYGVGMGRRLVAAAFGFAAVSAWFAVIPLTLLTALLPPSRYPSRLSRSSETSDASAWFDVDFSMC
jgi:hypothetical protein